MSVSMTHSLSFYRADCETQTRTPMRHSPGSAWPEDVAPPHLSKGRLKPVLDDWRPLYSGYHLCPRPTDASIHAARRQACYRGDPRSVQGPKRGAYRMTA